MLIKAVKDNLWVDICRILCAYLLPPVSLALLVQKCLFSTPKNKPQSILKKIPDKNYYIVKGISM